MEAVFSILVRVVEPRYNANGSVCPSARPSVRLSFCLPHL